LRAANSWFRSFAPGACSACSTSTAPERDASPGKTRARSRRSCGSSSTRRISADVSYIDNSLIPGEVVVHRAHVSWWSQAGLLILGVLLLIVVIGLFFLIAAWIKVSSTELAITNKR